MVESSRNLEPAAELKFGQVGIANLRLKRFDAEAMSAELALRLKSAPQLFLRTPVVLDLSHLPGLPGENEVRDLFARIRAAGMLPVGLSYGTSENEALARSLDLPLFAKFRAAFERAGEPAVEVSTAAQAPAETSTRSTPPPPGRNEGQTLHHDNPVRSGQQVYARGGDLVLTKLVANGAEVIADGSIHVYGALRGRALAGAQGNTTARIYCQEFHAELVSIAGQYRVFEDLPPDLRGKPVQAWLEGEKLLLARLG
ncbi:septum site-determining protein MinC [Dokdonella sp.]|uniref:septum site-determining protein MinC n=1 Tax=Dokdonella sp. TaxID=2291710 RepID=UPI002BD7A1B1|nr:septum site-determining protein MinC [Dokdonella sp.]HPN79327.1 septum site-determining protein MinC [Dokdonella sp.]